MTNTLSKPTATKTADPCVMVIFGAAGDLTKRLLMPSLYNLSVAKRLPAGFAIIGLAHTDINTDDLRASVQRQHFRCC